MQSILEQKRRKAIRMKAYFARDVEKWKIRRKERYQANSVAENRAGVRWRRENKERLAIYDKARAETQRVRLQRWRLTHPEHKMRLNNRRRARLNGGGNLSVGIVERLLDVQRRKCVYCEAELGRYHVDHIRPLAKGGLNQDGNVQLLCPSCNVKKGMQYPYEYRRHA